ncbi:MULTISPECIES: 1-acyl-sn-glycerol-3-phosphate acyltransferase [Streptacidiphilus]|uniref:1-acyl-sn-glycerol-3-phosphate acyltransferase n=1 Tax=Streptacidiphilus cavernicola TaxID=3342716 RepID=A0ABV6UFS5_9ACTN|nr:1-acyl-sn-glycerol-3-phosphate acyltransferase [Streptacidiphilus jeojiense]
MSSAREQAGTAGGPAGDGEARAKVIPIGTGRGSRAGRDGRGARGGRAAQRRTEELADPTVLAGAEPGTESGLESGPEPVPAPGTEPAGAGTGPEPVSEPAGAPPERAPGRGVADSVADAVGHALAGPLGGLAGRLLGRGWEERAAGGLGFLRRRLTGEYEVDEFGFDPELTEKVLLSAVRPLAEKYFRLEVRGAENLPEKGGALVVANHSGVLPLDALMTQVAIHDHTPTHRHLRMLAADLVFVLPGVNELARKAGHTLACNEDAQRLLELGEIVGVWPEGFKGIGKPFADRYKLQRFGRGGFVSSALRAGVPIVPCSIVGAEEIYPMIGNARTLARLLGLPYVPITPTFPWLGPLGAVPLPTKWTIQFGEPIPTDSYPPEAADDPMLLFNLTDEVRETVQHTLYKLLVQRRSVFF